MLFCCLWRNVETSCHKYLIVVSRYQQASLRTTSGKCHNLQWSGGTVLITSSRSQRLQHATKPEFSSKQNHDFCLPHLHSMPPLRGGGLPSEYCCDVLYVNQEWCGYQWWKNFLDMTTCFDRIHECNRQTDIAGWHRPRLCTALCSKNHNLSMAAFEKLLNVATESAVPTC